MAFAGFSDAPFTNATNAAAIFARFKPFEERIAAGDTADKIIGDFFARTQQIEKIFTIAIPPPIRFLVKSDGFKVELQNRADDDVRRILATAYQLMGQARQNSDLAGAFTTFSNSSPQDYLKIDRQKAGILNVPIPNIFGTPGINLGTAYMIDFDVFGPVHQVHGQADQRFRIDREEINRLRDCLSTGGFVPMDTAV